MSEEIEFVLLVSMKGSSIYIRLLTPVKEIAEKSVINLDDLMLQINRESLHIYSNDETLNKLKSYIKSYIELRLPLESCVEVNYAYEKINTRFIDESFRDEIKNISKCKFLVKWTERLEYEDTYLTNNNNFNF